jgi:hypothetical protein
MAVDQMPVHKAGCDGTEMDGPCAACIWRRERVLEFEAYGRFVSLFQHVPYDTTVRIGWG